MNEDRIEGRNKLCSLVVNEDATPMAPVAKCLSFYF